MIRNLTAALGATLALLGLAGCERPPMEVTQIGYPGVAMQRVVNPRIAETVRDANALPTPPGPVGADAGPKASAVYQNVKVLGDLSVANFNRHMASITQWVSPKEGCNYCHIPENFADDSKYTKVVARRMIQMTQTVNAQWKDHVAATGVTCYTCHRGNPVPANIWFTASPQDKRGDFLGNLEGQNNPNAAVAMASLPYDPFTRYLKDAQPIRVNSATALPNGNPAGTKDAEHTFGLMMHFSKSLGVNCTHCHNTRSMGQWNDVPPQLAQAWHGIRMVRTLNNDYLAPLTPTFPANRLGPTGDVAKVACSTCHQGVNKPLYGAQMAKDFPELLAAVKAVQTLPEPVAEARRSVLYFDVGSATLQGMQEKGLAQLIATMSATPAAKVSISGYHSAAGTLAQNQELAKQRAFSVRDALLAAGIAESRVALQKPVQAEANVAGEDPAARRVEVTLQ